MRTNPTALAVLALFVIAAALTAAVAGTNGVTSTERPAPRPDGQQAATPAPTERAGRRPCDRCRSPLRARRPQLDPHEL